MVALKSYFADLAKCRLCDNKFSQEKLIRLGLVRNINVEAKQSNQVEKFI